MGKLTVFVDDLRADKELYPLHELEKGFEKVIWPPYPRRAHRSAPQPLLSTAVHAENTEYVGA